jgi:hypothetical protein
LIVTLFYRCCTERSGLAQDHIANEYGARTQVSAVSSMTASLSSSKWPKKSLPSPAPFSEPTGVEVSFGWILLEVHTTSTLSWIPVFLGAWVSSESSWTGPILGLHAEDLQSHQLISLMLILQKWKTKHIK